MVDGYRDQAEIHRATPFLAMIVAAMTLATAPLTQSVAPAVGAAESSQAVTKREDRVAVATEIDPPPAITEDSETDTPSQS